MFLNDEKGSASLLSSQRGVDLQYKRMQTVELLINVFKNEGVHECGSVNVHI